MVWDITKPAASDKLKIFPVEQMQADKKTLRDAWNTEHEDLNGNSWRHKDNFIALRMIPDGLITMGKLHSAVQSAISYGPIPAGTKMVFYQASAPAGWTQDTSVNDRVLRVVNSSGGGTGGSWTVSGLTVSGSTDSTALSESQIPSHRHTIIAYSSTLSGNYNAHHHRQSHFSTRLEPAGSSETIWRDDRYTEYTGSGAGHNHTISSASISSDGSWRPAYANIIVCTKN